MRVSNRKSWKDKLDPAFDSVITSYGEFLDKKMKSIFGLLLLIVLLFCVGCVFRPTSMQLREANYGPYPIEYESIIINYYNNILKDPDSAKFKFTKGPAQYWLWQGWDNYVGWLVCGTINAKNSFGGYTGQESFMVLIHSDRIILRQDKGVADHYCDKL